MLFVIYLRLEFELVNCSDITSRDIEPNQFGVLLPMASRSVDLDIQGPHFSTVEMPGCLVEYSPS